VRSAERAQLDMALQGLQEEEVADAAAVAVATAALQRVRREQLV